MFKRNWFIKVLLGKTFCYLQYFFSFFKPIQLIKREFCKIIFIDSHYHINLQLNKIEFDVRIL